MPRLAALTRRELRLPGRLPRRHTRTASESCTSRPHWTPAHERGREHGALLSPLAQEASVAVSSAQEAAENQCPRGPRYWGFQGREWPGVQAHDTGVSSAQEAD